jgi:O-antigen/teichoic acid export membrane protein
VTPELSHDDRRSYTANLSAQLIGRVSSVVATLLVFVLIAREFGAEQFGLFSLVLTFLSVLIVVADFGTTPALARELSRPGVDRERLWGAFLLLRLALAASVTVIALLGSSLFRPDLVVLVVVGVLGLPLLASRFFEPVFQVSSRPWYSAQASLVYGLVYLTGAAVAVLVLGSLFWAVVAYVAANGVYCGVALGLSRRCIRPRFERGALGMSSLARVGAPLGVGSIFVIVNTRADILMLAYLQSDTAVGLYNAAFRFFDLAAMAAVMVMVPFVPIFSRRAARDRAALKALYVRVLEGLGVIILPVAIAVPSFSAGLVSLVFGPDFVASAGVLNVLAWVGVLTFVCHADQHRAQSAVDPQVRDPRGGVGHVGERDRSACGLAVLRVEESRQHRPRRALAAHRDSQRVRVRDPLRSRSGPVAGRPAAARGARLCRLSDGVRGPRPA